MLCTTKFNIFCLHYYFLSKAYEQVVDKTKTDYQMPNQQEDDDENDIGEDPEQFRRTRLQITTTEPRTIIYLKQLESLTEKQIDHMLCKSSKSCLNLLFRTVLSMNYK